MTKHLFWDMDGTLGNFDTLVLPSGIYRPDFFTLRLDEQKRSVLVEQRRYLPQLRPDILETLEDLATDGFVHVLTTSAPNLNNAVHEILRVTGLEKYFTGHIFHGVKVGLYGKEYEDIFEALGISDPCKDVITIGDSEKDQAYDGTQTVHIFERYGAYSTARRIQYLVKLTSERGNGSFIDGFRNLRNNDMNVQNDVSTYVEGVGTVRVSFGNHHRESARVKLPLLSLREEPVYLRARVIIDDMCYFEQYAIPEQKSPKKRR